ncbi:hypothetical protein K7711_22005 [Nocardia sp. CA2R105]|uniref:hypothetical protein n=1 Tax=Nocardia coffeae TaxID=2873381 RepID=UPI001CA73531|nr:hypothetical protein [Nocardia coffeae]MBY8859164.1 hypothetical protein [Nocardia coffeae]
MVTFLASVLVVAAFAVIVYRLALRGAGRAVGLLERYRPHAPMSDWSLSFRDDQRQYADLVAAESYRDAGAESDVVVRPSVVGRRRVFRRAVQF